MKTDRIIASTLIALCFASVITGFIFQKNTNPTNEKLSSFSWSDSSFGIKKADIAVIDISGPIMYSESNGFGSSGVNANDIIPMLEQIKKDNVKGIFLRINSPGGTAAASQAIYEKIMSIKKTSNIKVVSFMEDIAASGAYYIASASDVIYANPSTLVGSIGVIMQIPNYTELQNKVGYQTNTIKSGKFKDIGNSSRKMTDDERTLLQNLINDTYNEFAKSVSKGRKLSIEKVKQLGDGRIFTGNQANDNKLIDKLGSESDAISELSRELKLDGEPKLKNYSKASWEKLFGGLSSKSIITGTVFDSPEFSASFNKIPLTLYR